MLTSLPAATFHNDRCKATPEMVFEEQEIDCADSNTQKATLLDF
jgi:hypothetical protein